jgi:hypothetical protein
LSPEEIYNIGQQDIARKQDRMKVADLLRLAGTAEREAGLAERRLSLDRYKADIEAFNALSGRDIKEKGLEVDKFKASSLDNYYRALADYNEGRLEIDDIQSYIDNIKTVTDRQYKNALIEGDKARQGLYKKQVDWLQRKMDAADNIAAGKGTAADHAVLKDKTGLSESQERLRYLDATKAKLASLGDLKDDRVKGKIAVDQYIEMQPDATEMVFWDTRPLLDNEYNTVKLPKDKTGRQITVFDIKETADKYGLTYEDVLIKLRIIK